MHIVYDFTIIARGEKVLKLVKRGLTLCMSTKDTITTMDMN